MLLAITFSYSFKTFLFLFFKQYIFYKNIKISKKQQNHLCINKFTKKILKFLFINKFNL